MTHFAAATWRFIQSPPTAGAWNMAVDEAILESAIAGNTTTTLRLYAWQPACLSLGYAQPLSDVERSALRDRGWDIVRRPTGGRAILHTDELTYAVIGSQDDPRLSGGVLETYRNISNALLRALHLLGVPAVQQPLRTAAGEGMSRSPQQHNQNPVCFVVPSDYEITFDRKKLIGSAQARRKGCLLQHGSLPLRGDLERITHVLRFSTEFERRTAGERLADRATTLQLVLGEDVSWSTVAGAFRTAFAETLNLDLVESGLTQGEIDRAGELVESKYAHQSWTERVS